MPGRRPIFLRRCSGRKLAQDEDPFAPTGVQIGAFNLRPAVEATGGYDSNAPRSSIPQPSAFSQFASELLVNSNWARHELTAALRGALTSYEQTKELNRPDFDGRVNGRVDVTSNTRAAFEARFLVGTDNPGSPKHPGQSGPAADIHDAGRYRRSGPAFQPL
jgi:hypothetical protein